MFVEQHDKYNDKVGVQGKVIFAVSQRNNALIHLFRVKIPKYRNIFSIYFLHMNLH